MERIGHLPKVGRIGNLPKVGRIGNLPKACKALHRRTGPAFCRSKTKNSGPTIESYHYEIII